MSSPTHEPSRRERYDKGTTSRAENKIISYIFYPKAQCILQCVALKVVNYPELLILNAVIIQCVTRLCIYLGKDLGKVCAYKTYDNQRVRHIFRQSGNWCNIFAFPTT